jgi:hypothetical protein
MRWLLKEDKEGSIISELLNYWCHRDLFHVCAIPLRSDESRRFTLSTIKGLGRLTLDPCAPEYPCNVIAISRYCTQVANFFMCLCIGEKSKSVIYDTNIGPHPNWNDNQVRSP